MATFLASGADILQAPNINTTSDTGQDSAGTITVTGGTQPFSDQGIIEFTVDSVLSDGELTSSSGITQIVVYASQADYLAGTPTYTYTPQNSGESAGLQDSIDRMGDDYVRFDANILTSDDPGAPSLGELFVAPGSNVANQGSTSFDHHSDQDFNEDGSIDSDSGEDGNGRFNVNSGQANGSVCFTSGSYIRTPSGPVLIENLKVAPWFLHWMKVHNPSCGSVRSTLVPHIWSCALRIDPSLSPKIRGGRRKTHWFHHNTACLLAQIY